MPIDRERQSRPSPDEVAAMLALPPEDPRRREWERDPEHLAIAQSYEAFLAGHETDSARVDEAEAALRRALAQELGSASSGSRPGSPRRRSLAPAWPRWAAVAAGLVIVVGAGWLLRPDRGLEGPTGQLRGEGTTPSSSLMLSQPVSTSDGVWTLSWSADPRAESYHVVFYGPDLEELRSHDTEETELRLSGESLAELGVPLVLWRVEALRDGDVQTRSEVGSLRLDRP